MVSVDIVKRERKSATRELEDGVWKSAKNELEMEFGRARQGSLPFLVFLGDGSRATCGWGRRMRRRYFG
jgi:hypothetical protein